LVEPVKVAVRRLESPPSGVGNIKKGNTVSLVVLILPWKWHEKLVSSFLKLD
jgi:hypothetical protein